MVYIISKTWNHSSTMVHYTVVVLDYTSEKHGTCKSSTMEFYAKHKNKNARTSW